jgi:hypothetical protein
MIEVYGSSDDLVELEGAISEEFTYDGNDEEGCLLAFSNGVVLRIKYGDQGVWRITPVAGGPVAITQAPEDDESNYSDRALVAGEIAWVVFGSSIAKAKVKAKAK